MHRIDSKSRPRTMLRMTHNMKTAHENPVADQAEDQRPRKRNRKIISCESCHRQKVKCDRQLPCQRCIAGNRASQCTYQAGFVEASPNEPSISSDVPDATESITPARCSSYGPLSTSYHKGRRRFKGRTHWSPVLHKVSLADYQDRGEAKVVSSKILRHTWIAILAIGER
jgi:Fungal Zn(2)-Cys(6) binuclear cluster domain